MEYRNNHGILSSNKFNIFPIGLDFILLACVLLACVLLICVLLYYHFVIHLH